MANFQQAKDTAANWASNNRTPLLDEWCVESDDGLSKFGDGSTAYNSLPYFLPTNHLPGPYGHIPGLVAQQPVSGKFIIASMPGCGTASGMETGQINAVANGNNYPSPFVVTADCTLNSIGCGWHSTGTTGAVVRLGIWADDGGFWPGARIVDAGTINATTSNLGNATISQAIKANTVYWATAVIQGAPASLPNLKANGSQTTPMTNMYGAAGQFLVQDDIHNAYTGYFFSTGVTGALGSNFATRTGGLIKATANLPVITLGVA